MDSLVNVNHAISIVGYWIFDSNYEQIILLKRELSDLICSPSVGKEQVVALKQYFSLLDTCGHKIILNLDKYEDIGNMTIHKDKNLQELRTKLH